MSAYLLPFSHHYTIRLANDLNDDLSLDSIASNVFQKEYVGLGSGDVLNDDRYEGTECFELDMTEHNAHMILAEEPGRMEAWMARDDSLDQFDYQTLRATPSPEYAIAWLVTKGFFPYGQYLLRLW